MSSRELLEQLRDAGITVTAAAALVDEDAVLSALGLTGAPIAAPVFDFGAPSKKSASAVQDPPAPPPAPPAPPAAQAPPPPRRPRAGAPGARPPQRPPPAAGRGAAGPCAHGQAQARHRPEDHLAADPGA